MQGCWWVNKRIGSKQVSKTTYSDKNCWPTYRHWQWGTEEGAALVPKSVPTGQAERVLYGARGTENAREIFLSTYSTRRKLLQSFLARYSFVTISQMYNSNSGLLQVCGWMKRRELKAHSLMKLPWSSYMVHPIIHGNHHSTTAWAMPKLLNHSMRTN